MAYRYRFRGHESWLWRHSLSLALTALLVGMSVIYWFAGLADWRADQQAASQPISVWPDYVIHYVSEMSVSMLADVFGALLLVLFAKWFFEEGSPESDKQETGQDDGDHPSDHGGDGSTAGDPDRHRRPTHAGPGGGRRSKH